MDYKTITDLLAQGQAAIEQSRVAVKPLNPPPGADWDLWAHMPKATLTEAVAVSLGIDPSAIKPRSGYADSGREFDRRLKLACAFVGHDEPLKSLDTLPPTHLLYGPATATVSLPDFAAWAIGMGWALPERFPAPLMPVMQSPQAHKRNHTAPRALPARAAPAPAPVVAFAQTAPVPAVEPVSDAIPDPERRLALLRKLGGAAKYARCEWKFTGIKALVDSEKANGRKRSTEKTIRADLKEAAQTERDNRLPALLEFEPPSNLV